MPELAGGPAAPRFGASVYIGRFQPFHLGHAALLQWALAVAPVCVVVLGSAFQARSPKNPFTWVERAEMIRLALPACDRERVRFLPLRDYYNQEVWAAAVRKGVAELLAAEGRAEAGSVALVGYFKDATSDYLNGFPGWALLSAERGVDVDATLIRNAYFGRAVANLDATLGALVAQAPASTLDFMRAWAALPPFRRWPMNGGCCRRSASRGSRRPIRRSSSPSMQSCAARATCC
jgi:bifunctional NMN adenylyltransferase/nudix hydrolase